MCSNWSCSWAMPARPDPPDPWERFARVLLRLHRYGKMPWRSTYALNMRGQVSRRQLWRQFCMLARAAPEPQEVCMLARAAPEACEVPLPRFV